MVNNGVKLSPNTLSNSGNISGCQYYVKRAGGEILKRNPRTFRAVWKEEREMEELVGTVDSAGPRLLTLRTQVGYDC